MDRKRSCRFSLQAARNLQRRVNRVRSDTHPTGYETVARHRLFIISSKRPCAVQRRASIMETADEIRRTAVTNLPDGEDTSID